ncbi:MAG: phosphatase PAP2 family protein [Ardenticatenaceae bacterium]|nr:phosphatase PAP2 family protein [Ardenticatenaceae bacterium]
MDAIFDIGLNVTRWLQANYPQLTGFMQFMSALGETEFYLLLFPLLYWSVDKRMGKHVAYLFLLAVASNSLLKQAFRGLRPFWLDEEVGLGEAAGYGVPSGHAQLTAVIYPFLAYWIRRRWFTALAVFMVVVMCLSRIYLGVHFVHDVLVGLLLAGLILGGYAIWQRKVAAKLDKRILGQKLLVVVAVPVVFALLYVVVRLIIGEADTAVSWRAFIEPAERESIEAMVTAVAALLGFGIGVLFEASRVRFLTEGTVWQRGLRYVVGMVGTAVIFFGLRAVLPEDPLWLGLILRFVRYLLTLLWVSYYAPAFFVWVKLAKAEPDPGITLTL